MVFTPSSSTRLPPAASCWRRTPGPPYRFLDVGCGTATKVHAAAQLFEFADGLEYDRAYLRPGRTLLRYLERSDCAVIHADGLTFDDYGRYDALFMYQPIQDDDALAALERRIAGQIRTGAVVIAPYPALTPRAAAIGLTPIIPAIYVKAVTPRRIPALRRRAEAMGTALPSVNVKDSLRDFGWMAPLVAAARRQGFNIA